MTTTKLAIIGSGPSGYTAAIYAARALLAPVLFAGIKSGGQLMSTTDIENYPGFAQGVGGVELMMQMRQQAERFGTMIHDEYVTAVDFSQRPFKLWTNLPDGFDPMQFEQFTAETWQQFDQAVKAQPHAFEADSVIVSSGAGSIMVGVPGEKEWLGRGVSTCAVCDAAFYRDKVTYVVGGGDSAMEDTLALTKFASSVTIIHRRDSFRASKIMQERVLKHPKVKVLWNTQLLSINGQDKLTGITVKDVTGKEQTLPAEGVFVAIGHKPISQIFQNQLVLDNHGYVVTRQSASKVGVEQAQLALADDGLLLFPTMTSVEGVFGAGDVVDIRYRQAVTAAGQGAAAAIDVERWLEAQQA